MCCFYSDHQDTSESYSGVDIASAHETFQLIRVRFRGTNVENKVCLSACLSVCLSVCLSGHETFQLIRVRFRGTNVENKVCLSVCLSICHTHTHTHTHVHTHIATKIPPIQPPPCSLCQPSLHRVCQTLLPPPNLRDAAP